MSAETKAYGEYLYVSIVVQRERERERERGREGEREREIERDIYFLKVHLGDSNRQAQSSRENLEWYPWYRSRERVSKRERERIIENSFRNMAEA